MRRASSGETPPQLGGSPWVMRLVRLRRPTATSSWGFYLRGDSFPLVVLRVQPEQCSRLRESDTILKINGRGPLSYNDGLRMLGIGETVELLVQRALSQRDVDASHSADSRCSTPSVSRTPKRRLKHTRSPTPEMSEASAKRGASEGEGTAQPSALRRVTKRPRTVASEGGHKSVGHMEEWVNRDTILQMLRKPQYAAVYDCTGCPFTEKDGFTKEFHDQVQQLMTENALFHSRFAHVRSTPTPFREMPLAGESERQPPATHSGSDSEGDVDGDNRTPIDAIAMEMAQGGRPRTREQLEADIERKEAFLAGAAESNGGESAPAAHEATQSLKCSAQLHGELCAAAMQCRREEEEANRIARAAFFEVARAASDQRTELEQLRHLMNPVTPAGFGAGMRPIGRGGYAYTAPTAADSLNTTQPHTRGAWSRYRTAAAPGLHSSSQHGFQLQRPGSAAAAANSRGSAPGDTGRYVSNGAMERGGGGGTSSSAQGAFEAAMAAALSAFPQSLLASMAPPHSAADNHWNCWRDGNRLRRPSGADERDHWHAEVGNRGSVFGVSSREEVSGSVEVHPGLSHGSAVPAGTAALQASLGDAQCAPPLGSLPVAQLQPITPAAPPAPSPASLSPTPPPSVVAVLSSTPTDSPSDEAASSSVALSPSLRTAPGNSASKHRRRRAGARNRTSLVSLLSVEKRY